MSLLLCAATSFEIQPTINFIKEQQLDKQIRVLFTGVGLMAATYTMTKAVHQNRPDLILQAGIGGALDKNLQLAQVVTIKSECIGDLGVEESAGFRDLFSLGFQQKDVFPFNNGLLINPTPLLKETGLQQVDGVSVNEISTQKAKIAYYQESLNAQVESMEGAALHFIGLQESLSFLQLRSISNYIGERNKQAWKLQEAISTLNTELQKLITKQIGL